MKKFWGAEVKPGESLMVTPEDNIIHVSQASLDCVKGKLMGETVVLSVNVDGTKLVIGTLSQDKFPQISLDLVFEKNFELSHNCTKASVHFIGYKYPVPAPVAANRNAGAAASTVVKADSKPKAKPEEVKPESDDDSDDKDDESHDDDDSVKGMEVDEDDSTDQRTAKPEEVKPESDDDSNDKDDESHDDDDSVKGMDEDDSTDQRTVEAATQKSKRESDDDDDLVMGIAKKQKKVDENPDPSNVSDEEATTDEDAFIGVCQPTKIGVLNLGHHITENDIMKFFESTVEPQSVVLQFTRDENGIILKTDAIVEFQTAEQATLALKLKGEPLLGDPAYLARASNSRITVGIAGFNNELPEPTIKQQIIDRFHQCECGKVLQVFLPEPTLNIGFAYVFLDQSGVKEAEKKLAKVDETPIGEYHIMTWVAKLKLSVYKAKMGLGTIQEGDATPYLKKKDFLYIAEFQKFLDTIPPPDQLEPEPSTISFSWRNVRRDLFGPPGVQRACDCWARALSKGHSAALKLAGSSKDPVTKDVLLQSIDKRHQISGTGLIGMKYAKHFMESSSNCEKMLIYKRPVTDNYDDYEQFEETIISLLEASERGGGAPLAVTIDFLPSYGYFKGTGIYYAIDLDFMRRAHENLPLHVLFLSGHGYQVIGGVKREFWELQESKGSGFGDAGFVKIARHQCIIKQAYVFKV